MTEKLWDFENLKTYVKIHDAMAYLRTENILSALFNLVLDRFFVSKKIKLWQNTSLSLPKHSRF